MWTRQHKQRRTGRLIMPALTILFLSYFGFHAYHGEFGIDSNAHLMQQTKDLQARLDAIQKRRIAMERRVQLLHDGTLEKDMLDEQAREALNVSKADELTVVLTSDRSD